MKMQWNLQIKDNLGQPVLSFVRRLYSLRGSSCIGTKGRKYFEIASSVLGREAVHISECPLSEIPLYIVTVLLHSPSQQITAVTLLAHVDNNQLMTCQQNTQIQ